MNSATNSSLLRNALAVLLGICWATLSLAQQTNIRGTLRDSAARPVAHASVQLLGPSGRLISFMVSDTGGKFSFVLPDSLKSDQLRLEVNHLGYQKVGQYLVPGKFEYPITLVPQTISLAQVAVKSRPRISAAGDTLLYDIQSFAKGEDRSIGDVIKRLPGMEVDENGLIKFNGKSISNLYIDGDDLLAQRYAVGTRAIPHSMVKGLEVLQNHQERKVLKDKVLSDRVALNLVIKDEAKLNLSGSAKVAAGLPEEIDLEANTILFNKRYKMLNALNGNNTGRDLGTAYSAPGLLGTGTANAPGLPKSRYFFNRSASLNASHLLNTGSEFQWKASADLLVDQNQFTYQNRTDIYAGGDTIRYEEFQNTQSEPFLAGLSLQGRLNKDRYFFNNETSLRYLRERHSAGLNGSTSHMDQSLRNRLKSFSNILEYIPQLAGGNILSLRWQLKYQTAPQELSIQPGIHPEELNHSEPYAATLQYADMPGWETEASMGYRLTKGKISKNFSAAVRIESHDLHSQLRLWQNSGLMRELQGNYQNDLHWKKAEYAVAANLESKTKAWEWVLNLPLSLRRVRYFDRGFQLDESRVYYLFQPSGRIRYKTGPENYVELGYSFQNRTGTLTDLFRGAILRNYRSLYANEAGLLDESGHDLTANYHHRKTLQMLFLHAGINLNRSSASHISSQRVDGQISRIIQLPFANDITRFSAYAGVSKYIFAFGATAGVKVNWNTGRINQFFNGSLLPYRNVTFTISPELEMRLLKTVSLNYRADGRVLRSSAVQVQNAGESSRIYQLDESLGMTLSPSPGFMVRASGRHFLTAESGEPNKHFMFADVFLRYRLNRWKSDIELDVSNIANVRNYQRFSLSANRYTHDQYKLRGRMFLLRYAFNF